MYFEYICWKFAGRLLDRVNTSLLFTPPPTPLERRPSVCKQNISISLQWCSVLSVWKLAGSAQFISLGVKYGFYIEGCRERTERHNWTELNWPMGEQWYITARPLVSSVQFSYVALYTPLGGEYFGGGRPVESHSGTRGNIHAGPPNIFAGPFWGDIFKFFFSKWCILVYFIISERRRGPQTSRGPG